MAAQPWLETPSNKGYIIFIENFVFFLIPQKKTDSYSSFSFGSIDTPTVNQYNHFQQHNDFNSNADKILPKMLGNKKKNPIS